MKKMEYVLYNFLSKLTSNENYVFPRLVYFYTIKIKLCNKIQLIIPDLDTDIII